jgi:hypothetical protein
VRPRGGARGVVGGRGPVFDEGLDVIRDEDARSDEVLYTP